MIIIILTGCQRFASSVAVSVITSHTARANEFVTMHQLKQDKTKYRKQKKLGFLAPVRGRMSKAKRSHETKRKKRKNNQQRVTLLFGI